MLRKNDIFHRIVVNDNYYGINISHSKKKKTSQRDKNARAASRQWNQHSLVTRQLPKLDFRLSAIRILKLKTAMN